MTAHSRCCTAARSRTPARRSIAASRTGADKGYVMVIPEDGCSTTNADWHNASINYALQNVAAVTKTHEVITALG